MKRKRILILVILMAVVLGLVFRKQLIQTYVKVFHSSMEAYAENLLAHGSTADASYGLWDVDVYDEANMVEFRTGGFGLAPSSTYQGFYYSGDNRHQVFSAADASIAQLEIDGDAAAWTDGTDNHGTSTRFLDRWFWYEASF